MSEAIDWGWLRHALDTPEVTLDVYLAIPEELARQVEVIDGQLVRCESPTPSHQIIAHNLVSALRDAAKDSDARFGSCHKVVGDVDVLITEVPRLHFRRPDVSVYRCIPEDRGRWRRKPYASDCLLVVEIVSRDSVTIDTRDKRAEYADAGIPHYWIVTMAGHDGPAMSVERFRLALSGEYVPEATAVRGASIAAIEAIDPLDLRVTWEQLDDGI
jgi:Uma2 family endonuclease